MASTVSKSLPQVSNTTVPGLPGLVQVYHTVAPMPPQGRFSLPSVVAPVVSATATMPEVVGVAIAMGSAKLALAGGAGGAVSGTRPVAGRRHRPGRRAPAPSPGAAGWRAPASNRPAQARVFRP